MGGRGEEIATCLVQGDVQEFVVGLLCASPNRSQLCGKEGGLLHGSVGGATLSWGRGVNLGEEPALQTFCMRGIISVTNEGRITKVTTRLMGSKGIHIPSKVLINACEYAILAEKGSNAKLNARKY